MEVREEQPNGLSFRLFFCIPKDFTTQNGQYDRIML